MEYPFKDLLPLDEVLEREGYYKDWTHLDPEVFYSLTQISAYIKTKGFGVDVRLLIAQLAEHFGLRVTQITDAMAEFIDLNNQVGELITKSDQTKAKAELSISQSELAMLKSLNALNVANGVDAKASNALNLSTSADALSKSVQEQFNQVVIDGDSSVEAAQARVDANGRMNVTLKDRLDKEYNKVNNQLVQTEKRSNTELTSPRFQNRKPMFTILDDDCNSEVLTQWVPILEEKDFHLSLASITQRLINNPSGLYLTIEQLKMLQKDYGVEVLSHTHTHPYLTNISDDEVRYQINTSRKLLQDNGLEGNIIVYPYGYSNINVRRILKEEGFRGAVDARAREDYVIKTPVNTFNLVRPSLMYNGTPMRPLSYFTDLVDQAIAENGWIIFMSHSQFDSFDGDIIRGLIDYINARDTEWVSVNEGLDKIGNIIDYGDYESRGVGYNYTLLDADNELTTNSKTFGVYTYTDANSHSANDLIDKFPRNKVTQTVIDGGNQNNVGFPKNQSGILLTYRFSGAGWQRQQYTPYMKNEIWQRYVKSDGSWSDWENVGVKHKIHRMSLDVGVVPPAGKSITVDIAGVGVDDYVNVDFKLGIAFGLVPKAYIIEANKIRIRIENTTDQDINGGSRPIRIMITKE